MAGVIPVKNMSKRSVTLTLEFSGNQIFYHWNYDPEVKNIGGSLGCVYPSGSLHDLSYDQLRLIGEGTHSIQINERERSIKGNVPIKSENEQSIESIKFSIFCEKVHSNLAGEPHCTILMNFNETTANEIIPLLKDNHIKELVEFARGISEELSTKEAEKYRIYSSSGSSTNIPLENLKAIKRYYG
jgi:hypothetical protein